VAKTTNGQLFWTLIWAGIILAHVAIAIAASMQHGFEVRRRAPANAEIYVMFGTGLLSVLFLLTAQVLRGGGKK